MAHSNLGGGLAPPPRPRPRPPPPPPPALSLARVNRLLRPLRSALGSLSTGLAHQHALDHAQHRPAPSTRPRPRLVDPDWASSPVKPQSRRRSSIAIGPQHHIAAAHHPTPDSSPFKLAARRRPPRPATTYGSRRAHPPPPLPVAPRSAPPPPVDQPSPRRDVRLTQADLRARLAHSDAALPTLDLQQRAATALRAYAAVLEAVSTPCVASQGPREPPSLAEVAARTLGSGIEDDLRALGAGVCADANEDGEAASVGMDRSASAHEIELAASTAQDEWYESSSPHAVRWMLGDHATSIVIDALEAADAPLALWECCFDLCLTHDAHPEASRFHAPVLAALLSAPRSPPPPSVLPLLRRTPSPSAFLHSALVPVLLASSFSQRLFYHPSLSLPSTSTSSPRRDAPLFAALLVAHGNVASAMLRSIRDLTASAPGATDVDPVDPDSARNMQDEVRRRVAAQARVAIGCALRACARPRAVGAAVDDGAEALEDVRDALADVLRASSDADAGDDVSLERDELAAALDRDGELRSATDDLRALDAVCALALSLRNPAAAGAPLSLSSALASLDDGLVTVDALDDALRRFLPLLLGVVGPLSHQAVDERLLDHVDASTPGGEALLRTLSTCSAASAAARAEAEVRLASVSGRETEDELVHESEPDELDDVGSGGEGEGEDDAEPTDYDEPVVMVSPVRSRAQQVRRRRQIVQSPEPDDDDDDALLGHQPATGRRIKTSSRLVAAGSSRGRSRSAAVEPSVRRGPGVPRPAAMPMLAFSDESNASSAEDDDVDEAREPDVLVLSPSPSTTPPPSAPRRALAHARPSTKASSHPFTSTLMVDRPTVAPTSEADDLDLLQSVKRRRHAVKVREPERATSGSASVVHDVVERRPHPKKQRRLVERGRQRRWTGGREEDEESEDELAM
ncbi:hypothetical protein JCM3775_002958 [Rhodotorula graminis]